jgi:tetratricopeptide (TPR) repeat protein
VDPSSLMSTLRVMLCAVLAATGIARAAPETPAPSPDAREAISAYLRDPGANAKTFLDAARQQDGEVSPIQALLLGDAAIRIGQYRTASEFFMAVNDAGLAHAAELGMAWASLGRGQLTDAYGHFDAAGSLDPALRPVADFAMALLTAASGSPDGPAALAAVEAREGNDQAVREVAPLLDAYSRYWSGDDAGAADAFTAFAIAHPDSRFADDALYAAAQAKLRAGRDDEAWADLEALAGDQPAKGRLSSRLVALEGRALLREGMRRDRDRPVQLLPRRLADLLDGDGVRLAQAALAARRPPEPDATVAGGAPAVASERAAPRATDEAAAETGSPSHPTGSSTAAHGASRRPQGSGTAPMPAAPFPWTVVIALGIPIVLLALWWLARGRQADHAGSR